MSVTFTYAASDGPVTMIGVMLCRCDDVECEHRRYELNVCEANADRIFDVLGVVDRCDDPLDPLDVLRSLSSDAAHELPRRYLTTLRDLAADAVQRGVRIGWA